MTKFKFGEVRIVLPAGRGLVRYKMYYVYILKSLKDQNLYIGRTNDIHRRLREHNSGKVQSTKSRVPFIILEKIETLSEKESIRLELEYKKGYKREEIKRKFGGVA